MSLIEAQALSTGLDIPSPHLFSQSLSLEQALLVPIIEEPPASLATHEIML